MKVLHLPFNIASMMGTTVRALRSIGVEARGFARQFSVLHDYAGLETIDWSSPPKGAARLARSLRWRVRLIRAIAWADVIHWHWAESTWSGNDLRLIRWFRKPALVEFYGDDVRLPKIAARDNPYLARMYVENPDLLEAPCGRWLNRFARCGFDCLVPGFEMADYLDNSLFDGYYQTVQLIDLEQFEICAPDPTRTRPLLVHAPSNKARKGTEALLSALERLRGRHKFDFQLIHNVPRSRALEIVKSCDLFLDQFTVGGEGLASHEAMAFGKPVVCFIKESIRGRYPADLPIVSATQDSLAEVLPALLTDGPRRHELGLRGRAYVEAHNDARKLAGQLLEIYEDVWARRRPGCKPRCRHWRMLAKPMAPPEVT
jgi:glycosyltransferase involved in cell wall biosynthesis